MNRRNIYSFIALMAMGLSTVAEAKRNPRKGINFGIGLRLFDAQDQTKGQGDEKDSQKNTETSAVHPYLGLVLGDHFNLGVSGIFEEQSG